MFGNYLKIAWRSLWKHKLFSTIIFGGLAVGMAAILLIAIYLRSELSFDNFHANGKDLYRAGFRTWQKGALLQDDPAFTAPFGIYAKIAFPEIQSVCRLSEQHEAWLTYAGKSIKSSNITYADSSFFGFFSFKLLAGNPGMALDEPHAIVLTEHLSNKIFGNIEPIGKHITLDGKADYLVTGMVADPPYHSTLQFDALISLSTLYHDTTVFMDWNGGWQYQHYLELQPGADYERLAAKFKNFMASNYNQKYAGSTQTDAYLQPLAQIHLKYESDSAGKRTNIYVFTVIALLILSIACINYINLSVAKASSRYKEIGIRKVLGAFRLQLVLQFLGESVLVTALSFLLGLVLVIGLLPTYEHLSGQTIRFSWHDVLFVFGMFLVFVLIISLAAGSYLALYLSSFSPVSSLRKFWLAGKRANAANTLVVLQFCISAALISVVFVVNLQVRFLKNRPLGFDKEHILVLPLTSDLARDKASLLKQNILRLSSVSAASAMSEIPYDDIAKNGFLPEGTNTHVMAHQLDADEDLLKTLHIQLVAGRYFSAGDPRSAECYLVNQAFADKLGWKDPLNKVIKRDNAHRVIG